MLFVQCLGDVQHLVGAEAETVAGGLLQGGQAVGQRRRAVFAFGFGGGDAAAAVRQYGRQFVHSLPVGTQAVLVFQGIGYLPQCFKAA